VNIYLCVEYGELNISGARSRTVQSLISNKSFLTFIENYYIN